MVSRRAMLGLAASGLTGLVGCVSGGEPVTEGNETSDDEAPDSSDQPDPVVDECQSEMNESDPRANYPAGFNRDLTGVRTTEVFDIAPDPTIPDSKIVKPHALIIDNHFGDINLHVEIEDVVDDTVLHDEDFTLPGATGLRYEIHTPSKYHVHLSVEGWEATHSVTVSCQMIDCNASKTTFQILEEEVIASMVLSTTAQCDVSELRNESNE